MQQNKTHTFSEHGDGICRPACRVLYTCS